MKNFTEFLEIISKHGKRTALVDDASGEAIAYTQLLKQAKAMAGQLTKNKIQQGDRIAFYKIRDIDWVQCFLGAQLANVIVVPLDSRLSEQMVKAVIAETKPKLLITDEDLDLGVKSLSSADLLTKRDNSVISKIKDNNQPIISEILLTSGTWSQPKGVTLTQENLLHNLAATYKRYPLNSDEVFLSILPLAHAYEQMCGLLMPLYAGAKIVYIDEITSEILIGAFKKHRVTMVVAVPRILEMLQKGILRKLPKKRHAQFLQITKTMRHFPKPIRRKIFSKVHRELAPNLHTLVIGGAPYDRALDNFFSGLGYQTLLGYGLSETSPIISICTQPQARVKGSVGKPVDNLKVKINDKGEILVKGPSVFYGYWPNRHRHEWFNTEDQGYINNRGHLVLTGRTKNLIVYPNGDKLFLEDVERVADSLSEVEESCVLYSPQDFNGVFSMVVKVANGFGEASIKDRILSQLPSTVRIDRIINIFPRDLPRTHTLKLNRHKIYEEFQPENIKPAKPSRQR